MWDEILKKYRGWERVRPIHGVFFIWAVLYGQCARVPKPRVEAGDYLPK